MTPSPLSRKTSNLSESVRQQLKMYALAASAAGVGTLALSQPSAAKIVYTKTHRVIGEHYHLDLNHDGTADFKLTNDYYPPQYYLSAAQPGGSNGVAVNHSYLARALFAGAKVGPRLTFHGARMAVSDPNGGSDWYGPWVNVRNRYLGLSFKINGKTHYGWARLNVKLMPYHGFTATLTGYAYETTPNKPIIAGRTTGTGDSDPTPGTLGSLALGRK